MKNLRPLKFLPALALVIGACIAETQEETDIAAEHDKSMAPSPPPGKDGIVEIDENAIGAPRADLSDLLGPVPANLGIPPVNGSCVAAIGAYCPKVYGAVNGGVMRCYCQCDVIKGADVNNVHPDCAAMPTAKQCGTLFDAIDPMAGTYTYTFPPIGQPFACQQIGSMLAPTVP